MGKYIDLEVAKKVLEDNEDYYGAYLLESVPEAKVVEVRRGRWELYNPGIMEVIRCSCCGAPDTSKNHPPYCKECGAQMYAEVECV